MIDFIKMKKLIGKEAGFFFRKDEDDYVSQRR